MTFHSRLIALATAVSMTLSPVAQSLANSSYQNGQPDPNAKYIDTYEVIDNKTGAVSVFKAGKLISTYEPSSREQLRLNGPSVLESKIKRELAILKKANKDAFLHSTQRLLPEMGIFALAMGAVSILQLSTNFAQNPIAMQQHVEHQLSPIGALGFYSFIYSSAFTRNVLEAHSSTRRLGAFIPYLGMTAGFFVQSYLSQIIGHPDVQACAKDMIGIKAEGNDKACDRAWNYLFVENKVGELMPGLLSMLISSAIAGTATTVAIKGITKLSYIAFNVFGSGAGMAVRGSMRLVANNFVQIFAFSSLDQWLNRTVTQAWKSYFDGNNFANLNSDLNEGLARLKKQGNSSPLLKMKIKEFAEASSKWRMMNLSAVFEAHANWSEALHQMLGMYNSSRSFYFYFVEELRKARFAPGNNLPLELSMPLKGVTPYGLTEDNLLAYATAPAQFELRQQETIDVLLTQIPTILGSPEASGLFPKERNTIAGIVKKLSSEDINEIGAGLLDLNNEMRTFSYGGSRSSSYYRTLYAIRVRLGEPNPDFGIGGHFLNIYKLDKESADLTKDLDFARSVGLFKTPHIGNYFLMKMICGPEAERMEPLVKTPFGNNSGFASFFEPPRITNPNDDFDECYAQETHENMLSHKVKAASGKTYKGFVSYLVSEARPLAIGKDTKSFFDNWWKLTTESQISTALEDYEDHYVNIVELMLNQLFARDNHSLNFGPIASGGYYSIMQELKVYLKILDSLLDPSVNSQIDFRTVYKSPLKNKLLGNIEREMLHLAKIISEIKISTRGNRKFVESRVDNTQLDEKVEKISQILRDLSASLGVPSDASEVSTSNNDSNKSTSPQIQAAKATLEALASLSNELAMFGKIANAVSWDKIQKLKRTYQDENAYREEMDKIKAAARAGARAGY